MLILRQIREERPEEPLAKTLGQNLALRGGSSIGREAEPEDFSDNLNV